MLLFIYTSGNNADDGTLFQYISCYCLSKTTCTESRYTFISIHLMLLFIGMASKAIHPFRTYFNTSHVTVYRIRCMCQNGVLNFNTSHVTVYPLAEPADASVAKFQYISCYCLSFSEVIPGPSTNDFNTSHVTVYQDSVPVGCFQIFRFQYISCYCLSIQRLEKEEVVRKISIHLMLLFI